MRALLGESDWARSHMLQIEIAREDGEDEIGFEIYLARRNVGRQTQIAKGLGQWFGAFDGEQLVAQMGIFHDDATARCQAVATRFTHRRRGICAALLRHVALWALGRAPDAQVVIVADVGSDAGRLYRRMGFAPVETVFGILKGGY
jgi:GNAT superfamily N-acetyltransferase